MTAYSLINCYTEPFSIGMYTSLDKLYDAIRVAIREPIDRGLSEEDIKKSYIVRKVRLDATPLRFEDFSKFGDKIEIHWEKVF